MESWMLPMCHLQREVALIMNQLVSLKRVSKYVVISSVYIPIYYLFIYIAMHLVVLHKTLKEFADSEFASRVLQIFILDWVSL